MNKLVDLQPRIVEKMINDNIDMMELSLKTLTEPDERYEHNDLLQEIQQMRRLKEKFSGN